MESNDISLQYSNIISLDESKIISEHITLCENNVDIFSNDLSNINPCNQINNQEENF